jgi:hypothetical protein
MRITVALTLCLLLCGCQPTRPHIDYARRWGDRLLVGTAANGDPGDSMRIVRVELYELTAQAAAYREWGFWDAGPQQGLRLLAGAELTGGSGVLQLAGLELTAGTHYEVVGRTAAGRVYSSHHVTAVLLHGEIYREWPGDVQAFLIWFGLPLAVPLLLILLAWHSRRRPLFQEDIEKGETVKG